MEWLEKVLEGTDNAAEIAAKIKAELPKNFIPKHKYNDLAESKRALEEKLDADIQGRLCEVAVRTALKSLSGDFKIKDTEVVKMLIDKNSVSVDENGSVAGLEEQLNNLKKEKPYLFGESLAGRTPFAGAGDVPTVTREQFEKMGYRERIKLYEEQPELYKNLNN